MTDVGGLASLWREAAEAAADDETRGSAGADEDDTGGPPGDVPKGDVEEVRGRRRLAEAQEEGGAVPRGDGDVGALDDEDDDENGEGGQKNGVVGSWMGVLSSTEVHYFVRIMPSSAAGVVHLEDYSY